MDPQEVTIPLGRVTLHGSLGVPLPAVGVVLFAHDGGSSPLSPRERFVAHLLQRAGCATLLFDLLTAEEELLDEQTMHLRFDVSLLTERLVGATSWVAAHPALRGLPIGYLAGSAGAAAALVAAARWPNRVAAVVSGGGRPHLAGTALTQVRAPTLLLVGARDAPLIGVNEQAMELMLHGLVQLELVPGATRRFDEQGALERVAELARDWFVRFLAPASAGTVPP